eukprot:384851-Ditylum_brightwellii.AAC.1
MPIINKFFKSRDHVCKMPYSLEIFLCGKDGCAICALVGCCVCCPETEDGEPCKEMLRFVNNPILNQMTRETLYLLPEETQKHIDNFKPTLEEQLKQFPLLKKGANIGKFSTEAVEYDELNKKAFSSTKGRDLIVCVDCGACQAIYSMKQPGNKYGPKCRHTDCLKAWKEEDNYVCGNAPKGSRLYLMQWTICCGQLIETQYYEPELIT